MRDWLKIFFFTVSVFAISIFATHSVASNSRGQDLQNIGFVEVHKKVDLRNKASILLGDIAAFKNIAQASQERLAKVFVANAPSVGQSKEYTSLELTQAVRASITKEQNRSQKRLGFKVPYKVAITNVATDKTAFSKSSVKEQIKAELAKSCSQCDFQLKNLQWPAPVLMKKLSRSKSWSLDFPSRAMKGSFALPIRYLNSEHSKRVVWLRGHAHWLQNVPVANRQINIGERISQQDFVWQSRDITLARDGALSKDRIEGAKLRRSLGVGEILWASMIERERAMKYGDIVRVSVKSEGADEDEWQISLNAIAQQSADIGDRVKLLNTKSRKYIIGVVTGPREVEVR